VLLGIAAAHVFNLEQHGVEIVGPIQSGLPSFGLPNIAAQRYLDLAPAAVGVMLVGFAESLGAAKTYAARNHYEIDANRELIGLGAANLGAGLSSGMVVNGSLSKTAVNASSGAKSQLSGLVVAVLTVITLLFLTGLFEKLPEATLAAVVIAALIELVDIPALRRLYRMHSSGLDRIYGIAARADFIAASAALLGVLIFDTLPGLFIGIGVSFMLLLERQADDDALEHRLGNEVREKAQAQQARDQRERADDQAERDRQRDEIVCPSGGEVAHRGSRQPPSRVRSPSCSGSPRVRATSSSRCGI
jgi:sulfate permease, SulP family